MVIVHVEDHFDPDAGYQINELLGAINKNKYTCYLITSKDMSPFHKKLDINRDLEFQRNTGVKLIRLDYIFKFSSRIWLKGLWKIIDSLEPNLVFLHGIGDFKDLVLYKKKKKYTIIRDCHMSWVASKNKFAKIFYKSFKLLFAKKINNSNKYAKIFALGIEEYEYLKEIGIKDEKIDFLYHGYNDNVIYYSEEERKEIRNIYGFRDNEIVISYIGKFNESKRPDLIIDIVNNLNREFFEKHKVKLLFIGSKNNEFMKYFNNKIKELHENVDYVIDDAKNFNELRKYFSATDICIFPRETTLSSLHAQICNCKVIMEKHKSNEERVLNKNTLFEKNNLNEASLILEKLILDNDFNNSNIDRLKEREYKNQLNKILNCITN